MRREAARQKSIKPLLFRTLAALEMLVSPVGLPKTSKMDILAIDRNSRDVFLSSGKIE
jgi:hypothetical protein